MNLEKIETMTVNVGAIGCLLSLAGSIAFAVMQNLNLTIPIMSAIEIPFLYFVWLSVAVMMIGVVIHLARTRA